MKLAVGQAPSTPHFDGNVMASVDLIARTANAGARLLLLSELFLNGYDLREIARSRDAVMVDDARLDPIRETCSAEEVSAVVGAVTTVAPSKRAVGADLDNAGLNNSVLWFGSDGSARIVYDKTHLWAEERGAFTPGADGVLVEFDGLTIGLGICYDAGFPEFCRAYAQAGAELILFASAFATGDERSRYHIYHPARALESGAFVAVSNALGPIGEGVFFGESAIYDPFGVALSCAGDEPGIVTAEIDRDAVATARASLHYLQDLHAAYRPTMNEEELR